MVGTMVKRETASQTHPKQLEVDTQISRVLQGLNGAPMSSSQASTLTISQWFQGVTYTFEKPRRLIV